jgi:hypothetical protein
MKLMRASEPVLLPAPSGDPVIGNAAKSVSCSPHSALAFARTPFLHPSDTQTAIPNINAARNVWIMAENRRFSAGLLCYRRVLANIVAHVRERVLVIQIDGPAAIGALPPGVPAQV